MTLTEQWKKGELKEGFYYVSDGAEITIDYYICDYWERHFDGYVQQVPAPVPSYKEWQGLKEFADYSLHNRDELTRQINFWMDKHTQIEKENQQLKELLKECKKELKPLWDEWLYDYGDKTGNNSARFLRIDDLLTKIDNVIGEKK